MRSKRRNSLALAVITSTVLLGLTPPEGNEVSADDTVDDAH